MEPLVSWRISTALCRVIVLVWLAPALAGAQTIARSQQNDTPGPPPSSRTWVVIGGAPTTLRGDCTFCEDEGIVATMSRWSCRETDWPG